MSGVMGAFVSCYVHAYTHVHTHIQTYVNTFIHTYIHTIVRYIDRHMYACMGMYGDVCMSMGASKSVQDGKERVSKFRKRKEYHTC